MDVPVGGEETLPLPLASPSLILAQQDSQDSISDIEGVTDDQEVSLMEWNADDAGGPKNGNSAAKISIAAASPHT